MTHTSTLLKTILETSQLEYLATGYAPTGVLVKLTLTEQRIKELKAIGYDFYSVYQID